MYVIFLAVTQLCACGRDASIPIVAHLVVCTAYRYLDIII